MALTLLLLAACTLPPKETGTASVDSPEGDSPRDTQPTESTGPTDSTVPTDSTIPDPYDLDGDGYTVAGGDCDDTDADTHPDAEDVPEDGVDQDCNGLDKCQVHAEGGGLWVSGEDADASVAEFCAKYDSAYSLDVENTDWVDMSAVSCLCEVREEIYIWDNASLVSLAGIEQIEGIDGLLVIYNSPLLSDISALAYWSHLEGLGVHDSPSLTSLAALRDWRGTSNNIYMPGSALTSLDGLQWVGDIGQLWVGGSNLTSIEGIENLRRVSPEIGDQSGSLVIAGPVTDLAPLASLTDAYYLHILTDTLDFSPLSAFTSSDYFYPSSETASTFRWPPNMTWGGRVAFADLPALEALDDPAPMDTLGDLLIEDNPLLVDISGLAPLTRLEGELAIQRNTSLASLEALHGLTWVGGDLDIRDNPEISDEEGWALVDAIGAENIGGDIFINHR